MRGPLRNQPDPLSVSPSRSRVSCRSRLSESWKTVQGETRCNSSRRQRRWEVPKHGSFSWRRNQLAPASESQQPNLRGVCESAVKLLVAWNEPHKREKQSLHTHPPPAVCPQIRGRNTVLSGHRGLRGRPPSPPQPPAPPAPLWLPPPASTRGAAGEGRAEAAAQGRARPLSDTVSPLCPPQVPPTGWVNALHGAAAGRWHGGHPRAGPSFPVRGRVPEDERALRAQNS